MGLETDFKNHFRTALGGWSTVIEPAMGGDTGLPDVMALSHRELFPVEVKLGVVSGSLILPSRIRPAQVSWLASLQKAGGRCCIVMGIPSKSGAWDAYAQVDCSRANLSKWKEGWQIGSVVKVMSKGKLDKIAWSFVELNSRR